MIPIIHHSAYAPTLPTGHRFPMAKFSHLARMLRAKGSTDCGVFVEPDLITRDALIAAHAGAYVDAVLAGAVSAPVARRIGLPVTPEVVLRARAASGGTLCAGRLALRERRAFNTAGGSHHAGPEGGSGFCIFNDVAVAALALLNEGAIQRALVIDLDVHQGDGTAAIFAHDPRVFTFSMHCAENFPTRKVAGDLDIALPKGAGDQAYLAALREALPRVISAARADIVFFNAGVDPHANDRLGFLKLTDQGLAARDRFVIRSVRAAGAALVGVIGGGYGEDAEEVAARHMSLFHAAAAEWIDID
jgi:acetoin utilization deacetylase AcuC-like enzyme